MVKMLDDWLLQYLPQVSHLRFQQKQLEAISQCMTVCSTGKDGDSTVSAYVTIVQHKSKYTT